MICMAVFLAALQPQRGWSQDSYSAADISVGYSLLRQSTVRTTNHGWNFAIAPSINSNLAFVVDFAGHYGSFNESDLFGSLRADVQSHSIMVGPRVSETAVNWRPFAQALVGYHRTSLDFRDQFLNFPATVDADTRSGVQFTAGAGIDYRVNDDVSIRLVQAEYAAQRWTDSDGTIEGARIGAGIVFHLGRREP